MSVRRWIGVAGLVVAVASGTAATVRSAAEAEFEAEVALRLRAPAPNGVPVPTLDDPERLFDQPEVRELVNLRLGESPPVRVKPATGNTVLVRSRGATAMKAAEATTAYAASYVDVQRRQSGADLAAAALAIQQKIDQLESQVHTGVAPQEAVELIGHFAQRLEELRVEDQSPNQGAQVVGLTSAEPVDDGARRAWIVALLGGTVALGAVASARRSGPGTSAGDGVSAQGQ